MGRCNPITKTCTRTPWWLAAMGIDWIGSSGGGEEPTYSTPDGEPVLTIVGTKTIVSGARWYGRTSMKVVQDHPTYGNYVVMAYREADFHHVNLDDVIRLKFSDDYGETWTDPDTYLDGLAVTGMPSYPANATPTDDEGAGEPWLMIAPNGDLLIHMWSSDYGVTNQGTYQTRSTDGGKTWDSPALITFVNNTGISISSNLNIFSTDDDFVYNGVIYAGAREYLTVTSFDSKIRSWLIKSEDNGITWELVSLLSHYDDVTNEFGLTNVQGTTIRAAVREFVTKAYYAESTDFGQTWLPLVEKEAEWGSQSRQRIKSDAQLKLLAGYQNDPVRILNGFIHVNPANSHPRRRGIWISKDYAQSFFGPFFTANAGYDGGYGDVIYNPDLDQYVYTCYFAPVDDTDLNDGVIMQDNFTIEWVVPTVLLSDDFTGTTLDPAKWIKVNPDAANLTLSQNGKLIFTRTTDVAVASTSTNYFESVQTFNSGFASITFNREIGFANSGVFLAFWKDSNNNIILAQQGDVFGSGFNNNLYIRVLDGGVTTYEQVFTIDSSNKRVAIEYREDGYVEFFHWNGARWFALGSFTTGVTIGSDWKVRVSGNSDADDAANDVFSFSTFRMTDIRHKYALPENTAIDYETLVTDNFNGTVIDTAKWVVTNPDAANLTISQNTAIIFKRTTDNAVASSTTNHVRSILAYSGDMVLTGRIQRTGMANSTSVLQLWVDNNNGIQCLILSGTIQFRVFVAAAGTLVNTSIAGTTATRVMMTYLSGAVRFYTYDTTRNEWVLWGTVVTGVTLTDLKVSMQANSAAADAPNDQVTFDDVRLVTNQFWNILP